MSKIKIGQIGVGHGHAKGKIGVLQKLPDFEFVGIAEPDAELRRHAQQEKEFQGVTWMTEEQLLNVPGLAAVAVETRVDRLLDTAETCVDAGLHLHLDKPAGTSLPQFKRILDTAARKHLHVQMGYMYRYNPAIVMLRDFLRKGWLGEPFEIEAVMSKVLSTRKRGPVSRFRGGMMFELGCHLIDMVVGLIGRPEKVTSLARHVSPIQDDLNDNMLAIFEYPSALVSVRSSGVEVEGFARRHLTVCGLEGTCHIQPLDRPNLRVVFSRDRGSYRKERYQEVKIGGYARYVADLKDLARILRGEKEPDFSYEHDLQVQETVLRASGMPVDR